MEETAYHEAGHAFMAVRLGATVRRITLEPENDDGPARFGDTQVEWRRGSLSDQELSHKAILVALAGPVAEMVYTGDPFHPAFVAEWSADWQDATRHVAKIVRDPEQQTTYLETAARRLLQLFRDDAQWAVIAALADELLAHETLEADAVAEILAACLE